MPKFVVVPQVVVDTLAEALSSDENTGRIIAEEICRSEEGGTLIQKIMAGAKLTPFERAQLPALRAGWDWEMVKEQIELPKEA